MTSKYFSFLVFILVFSSCRKNWLDAKPQKSLVVASTIKDYQSILDNTYNYFNLAQPSIGEIASGDFYVLDPVWSSLATETERQVYIWSEDGSYVSGVCSDWNSPYSQVLNSNIVLDGLTKITPSVSEAVDWNSVAGSALFYRAFAYFNLLQVFAKPYNAATAASDLGIPLKSSSDINEKIQRASVEASYAQVENDLMKAESLLPLRGVYKTRPSRLAVYAMLARMYLTKQNYDAAFRYSDSVLHVTDTLMDYNSDPNVHPVTTNSISVFNSEDLFHSTALLYGIFRASRLIVDSSLYNLYDSNDLRKSVFYTTNGGQVRFRGSYDGTALLYCGFATDEMILIHAECAARKGDRSTAMNDLNKLLQMRWKTGTFSPLDAVDDDDALRKILLERRKELCFRCLRWQDLRRLNQDSRFAIDLIRIVNGQTYALPANDKKYTMPIPNQEVQLSGIPQNQY